MRRQMFYTNSLCSRRLYASRNVLNLAEFCYVMPHGSLQRCVRERDLKNAY